MRVLEELKQPAGLLLKFRVGRKEGRGARVFPMDSHMFVSGTSQPRRVQSAHSAASVARRIPAIELRSYSSHSALISPLHPQSPV